MEAFLLPWVEVEVILIPAFYRAGSSPSLPCSMEVFQLGDRTPYLPPHRNNTIKKSLTKTWKKSNVTNNIWSPSPGSER